MHILVVDDEHDVQLLFEQRFRRDSRADEIALHFAFSGQAALDALKRQEAGEAVLILSDINMPGMSGLELLKRIKRCYTHLKVFSSRPIAMRTIMIRPCNTARMLT